MAYWRQPHLPLLQRAKSKDRIKYDPYRADHLFIDSGVIEAGCKHMVGHRLRQFGMKWTVRSANGSTARNVRVWYEATSDCSKVDGPN